MITSAEQALEFFYTPAVWEFDRDAADAADAHVLTWAKDMELVRSQTTSTVVTSWNLGASAAATFPHARGRGLDLVTDWIAWALFTDDLLNRADTPLPFVASVVDETFRVLHADPRGPAPEPLRGASQGLWSLLTRVAAQMSDEWLGRCRADVGLFMRGIVNKFLLTASPEPPDVETALAVRADDIAISMFTNLVEYFEGFELPMLATATGSYVRLRRTLDEAAAIQNDVFSFYRDLKNPDADGVMNIVAALERRHGQGTEHALLQTRAMYRDRLTALASARDQFPGQCRALGLDDQTVQNAEVYANAVHDMVHGLCHAHFIVAARGYMDVQSLIPPRSELRPDFDDSILRPSRPLHPAH
ncbi:hypothetical protein OHT20_00375 [Streptomyces caniferus]|uniref:terpene synthase family protein n=1 Tax=Streptomyces caniferus TaxID=285557 RepID=UPI002E27C9C5|nr:hypothetical protein [Streptomyces caniferus]